METHFKIEISHGDGILSGGTRHTATAVLREDEPPSNHTVHLVLQQMVREITRQYNIGERSHD